MKTHPRMLKLVAKLLVGQNMQFVNVFAHDFAKYRAGTADIHPTLQAAFQRFEGKFAIAFKYRRFIEQNHKLHTGIYGEPLLAIIHRQERGEIPDYREPLPFSEPSKSSGFVFGTAISKTLH